MAGVAGFEPAIPIPKTGALPLGHTPKKINLKYRVPNIILYSPSYHNFFGNRFKHNNTHGLESRKNKNINNKNIN